MEIKIHNPFVDDYPEGILAKMTRNIALVHHWLAGPQMTKQDRMNHTLIEKERWPADAPEPLH